MNIPSPNPTNCDAALAVLHRWLDREAIGIPSDVAAHLLTCDTCRGRFAASGQLAAALIRTETLQVPPLLTERIVAGVLADSRRRVGRWSLAGVGLAAGVALAVWLFQPSNPAPAPTPVPLPDIVESPPPNGPNVQQDFAEAGEAVAALTRRAAADVVGAGRQLLPTVPPSPWPPDLEPAARPFEGAGAALADGFEPVATSARRAAQMVWRELALDDDKK